MYLHLPLALLAAFFVSQTTFAAAPPARIDYPKLIADLDDDDFDIRQTAQAEIEKAGTVGAKRLWAALDDDKSTLEQKYRLWRALKVIYTGVEMDRELVIARLERRLTVRAKAEELLVQDMDNILTEIGEKQRKALKALHAKGDVRALWEEYKTVLKNEKFETVNSYLTDKEPITGYIQVVFTDKHSQEKRTRLLRVTKEEVSLEPDGEKRVVYYGTFLPENALLPNGKKVSDHPLFGAIRPYVRGDYARQNHKVGYARWTGYYDFERTYEMTHATVAEQLYDEGTIAK